MRLPYPTHPLPRPTWLATREQCARYYNKQGLLRVVDADKKPDDVYAAIQAILNGKGAGNTCGSCCGGPKKKEAGGKWW